MLEPYIRLRVKCAVPALASALALNASAAVVWNESTQGDLSGDRLVPTSLSLAAGSNDLIATSQAGDREYITFDVPGGHVLSSVFVRSYDGVDDIAFFGIQSGNTFTEPPTGTVIGNLLGYSHFGPGIGNVEADFLADVGTGAGSQGFVPPLVSGSYAVWMQQAGLPATYQLDFVITPVPEPLETAAFSALVLLGAAGIQRWRKQG